MEEELYSGKKQTDSCEEGLEIPLEQINPDTLRNMVAEFVTREWADLGDSDYTLENKIDQVLSQLRNNKAKVVFDVTSESWNIIAC